MDYMHENYINVFSTSIQTYWYATWWYWENSFPCLDDFFYFNLFIWSIFTSFEHNKISLTGFEKSECPWGPLFLYTKNCLRSYRIPEKYFWNFNFNRKCWKYSYKLGTQGVKMPKMEGLMSKTPCFAGFIQFYHENFCFISSITSSSLH